jgi:hypothetical protein
MRRWRTLTGLFVATNVMLTGLLAQPALALNPVVGDCYANQVLTHRYTVAQLQQALGKIPTDIAEYTNCPDVIRAQLDKQLGIGLHGGSGGGGGSSFLPVWLIILIVVIVLGGGGATVAARRRSGPGGEAPPDQA